MPGKYSIQHLILIVMFLFCVALWAPRRSDAANTLQKELEAVAKSVAQLLKAKQLDSIAIGQFTGPPNFPTSAGPGIVHTLGEEFKKQGITVKQRAAVGIKGEYSLTKLNDPLLKHDFLAIRIQGSLVDQFGEVLSDFHFDGKVDQKNSDLMVEIKKGNFERKAGGEDTVLEMMGFAVRLPADDRLEDRDRRIRESLVDPSFRIEEKTRLAAGPGSPYLVEILVNGNPRDISLIDGLPYVQIQKSEIYEIAITNGSKYDAAVKLTIDGLNIFDFSQVRFENGPQKGQPRYSVYIIPKQSRVIFKGWHRTNSLVDSFLVTEYAKSAAASVNQSGNRIGTITAQFSAAWPINGNPPPDESNLRRSGPNATGFGPPKKDEVIEVQRRIGMLRAAVSLRYSK